MLLLSIFDFQSDGLENSKIVYKSTGTYAEDRSKIIEIVNKFEINLENSIIL